VPAGLVATTAVRETVDRALRTFRWPHLAVALVDESLFGLSREDIGRVAGPTGTRLVDRLTESPTDDHPGQG
jgi:hypothetical protein